MKLKLAKRMQKARKRELDRARADLARIDTEIRKLQLKLEQTREQVRALHAKGEVKGSELELGHLRCERLEQELQEQSQLRKDAQARLISRHHRKEQGDLVYDRVRSEHQQSIVKQEQRCNDDRNLEHLKKLA